LRLTRADASSVIHAYYWTGSVWAEVGSGFDIGVISNLQVQIAARADNVAAEFTCFAFEVSTGLSATEPRYTCNGTFTADSKPLQTMKNLLTGAVGTVIWAQGQYYIYPGAYRAPEDYIITESDLAGPLGIQPAKSVRDKFNTVRGTFADPTDYWQPVDFPAVKNSTALAADGRELVQDIELLYTTSRATAQRLAKIHLEKELQGIIVNFPGKLTLFGFKPMDVVKLSISSMGWVEKEFRITKWEMSDNATINLVLREESAASYEWNSGMETVVDPAPNTLLPSPWNVPPPADLVLTDELLSSADGIVTKLIADITPAPDASVINYDVDARIMGGTFESIGHDLRCSLVGAQAGSIYEVRARAINSIGAKSAYITRQRLVMGLSAPPQDVTDFHINCIGTEAHLSWTPLSDVGLSHYTVKFSPQVTGATWSSSVSLVPQVSGNSVTVPAMVGTYLLKAVRFGGKESINALAVVSAIAGITGLNAVELFEPHPAWTGSHTNTIIFDGNLRLIENETMSDWTTLAGIHSLSYGLTGYAASGEYISDTTTDLGQVFTSRLTAQVLASAVNTLNVLSGWSSLSAVPTLSGADPCEWDMSLQVSYTASDPALNEWSAWQEFVVGDYSARAFRFRILLTSQRSYLLVSVSSLSIKIDMPDRVVSMMDVVCPAAGLVVPFSPPFRALKALAIDAQDCATGDYKTITNKSESGFTVRFFNASGTGVQRTFDALATGYGTQEV